MFICANQSLWNITRFNQNNPLKEILEAISSICLLCLTKAIIFHTCSCLPLTKWVLHQLKKRHLLWRKFGESFCLLVNKSLSSALDQLGACQTSNQEVAVKILWSYNHSFIEVDHEIFLQIFSPLCWFKKGSCHLVAKECALGTGEPQSK